MSKISLSNASDYEKFSVEITNKLKKTQNLVPKHKVTYYETITKTVLCWYEGRLGELQYLKL